MKKICLFTAIFVCSYGGWGLAQKMEAGPMIGFGMSFLGSVIGVVVGWWLGQRYFD